MCQATFLRFEALREEFPRQLLGKRLQLFDFGEQRVGVFLRRRRADHELRLDVCKDYLALQATKGVGMTLADGEIGRDDRFGGGGVHMAILPCVWVLVKPFRWISFGVGAGRTTTNALPRQVHHQSVLRSAAFAARRSARGPAKRPFFDQDLARGMRPESI